MASEPSSPAGEASPSRFELTPRSKVKALLASLDNDSDDENDPGSTRARLISAFTKPTSKEPSSNSNHEPLQISLGRISAGELLSRFEDEEDENIVRPKGRLEARMLETERNSAATSDKSTKRSPRWTTRIPTTKSSSGSSTEDDSDRNETPVVSRKRKVRVPRPSTPQLSPRSDSTSPGLFVSPTARRSATPAENTSDSEELPTNPLANDRFRALVEKKRQERLAKEKEAAAQNAEKMAKRKLHSTMLDEDEDVSDDNVERRLTQQAKPTRKASKRAQEEISRETQRMSRNMQLTHKAITKKKITKASLFAKFDYKTADLADEGSIELVRPTSSSCVSSHSDIEMRETPPTSPASHHSIIDKSVPAVDESMPLAQVQQENEEEDLPGVEDALTRLDSSPPKILNKRKEKAVEETLTNPPQMPLFKQRAIRIRPPKIAGKKSPGVDDSDSDLEIISAKTPDAKTKKLDSIFDRVPAKQAKESNSLHVLRMLAHITSPGKQNARKDKKSSMNTSELQFSLQQLARQQAAREREERLQLLRDKGVIVQTAEEREREIAEVDDLISKARREGEQIMKRERAAAKKDGKANGEVDPLGDSNDDEGWEDEKEDLGKELSGSDEEECDGSENDAEDEEEQEEEDDHVDVENEMELDGAEGAEAEISKPMFDDEADETDEEEEAESDVSPEESMAKANDNQAEDEEEDLRAQKRSRSRKTNVISDDEDEQDQVKETPSVLRTKSPSQLYTYSPGAPNSVLRSATKTFIPGLSVAGPAGLGLTQIFAGTMDESQLDISPTAPSSETHKLAHDEVMTFLRRRPVPELPEFAPSMSNDTQDIVVDSQSVLSHIPESQNDDSQMQAIQLQFSQSQIHGFDSLVQDPVATQLSEMPEATQDAGFQHMTPIRGRFEAPPSTVDTVVLGATRESEPVEDTPVAKKKGKLRRRAPQVAALSEDEDVVERNEAEAEAEDLDITANAFEVMRKASKKKRIVGDEFDKKKSGAKEMIDEQADESEDEYAGLGGASDDESGGEEDAYVKEIIDDEGGKDVDEHKLAAFFA
jgi:mediator of replication checkpoint protein 1